MWIERDISTVLKGMTEKRPVLILTGCRQTGKTSLLEHLFSNYEFVSLDTPRTAEQADESGDLFLTTHGSPLIIDEIQYAPQLLRHIKRAVDQDRNRSGSYLLTGSQKFSMMANVTESLAGRAAVLELHSLSLKELENWSGQTAEGELLTKWIFQGGYPELHVKGLDPQRFYSDYLATYLERDVRQLIQVKSLRDFDRFIRLAAIRTGQLLSMNSFASDLGISPNTVRSWLSVLEASNVISLVEPYYQNLGKRIVKTPKLYFLDSGLACYLAGFRSEKDLRQSELLGGFFETLVFGQIVRKFANRGEPATVYFFRDHFGHEVDFVIPVGEKLKLIECKWSENPAGYLAGFETVKNAIGERRILSQVVITPARGGFRKLKNSDTVTDDCIDLSVLD